MAELQQTIDTCKADIEAARAAFSSEVDKECYADGSKLDPNDIALLNANAVIENDLAQMLEKHKENFTMLKAIKAYIVRNNIQGYGAEDEATTIMIKGEAEEAALRDFTKAYFDLCLDAAGVRNGYNDLLLHNRDAVINMLREYGLLDTINVDELKIK